jgi:hypothetical protein
MDALIRVISWIALLLLLDVHHFFRNPWIREPVIFREATVLTKQVRCECGLTKSACRMVADIREK